MGHSTQDEATFARRRAAVGRGPADCVVREPTLKFLCQRQMAAQR